ncbi:hypothetical protein [Cystobacter fuscus]|nr:hypothetical protein [Cystobacter fuscus]
MKTPHPRQLVFLSMLLTFGLTGHAADSVTNACGQNPAYCAVLTGKEAAVPATKGAAEIASIAATLRLLPTDMKARVERELVECAERADFQVNIRRFAGDQPSREQCQEVLPGWDPCGKKVTRAMQLGTEKHQLALQCIQERFNRLFPGRFSLEQRYRYDKQTRSTKLISREEARVLRKQDCGEELKGTLVPDVVIHSGNPLEALAIYDFKFPCPSTNPPSWSEYPEGHPHYPENQGKMYEQALGAAAFRVAPRWRVR